MDPSIPPLGRFQAAFFTKFTGFTWRRGWALPSLPLEEIWQYSHEVSWIDLKTRMFWIPLKLLLHLLERLQSSFLLTQVSVLSAFGSYYVLIHILHVGPVVEWMPRRSSFWALDSSIKPRPSALTPFSLWKDSGCLISFHLVSCYVFVSLWLWRRSCLSCIQVVNKDRQVWQRKFRRKCFLK